MEQVIAEMRNMGRIRTSETYATTLRSLKRFQNGTDFSIREFNSERMVAYEAYLKQCGGKSQYLFVLYAKPSCCI